VVAQRGGIALIGFGLVGALRARLRRAALSAPARPVGLPLIDLRLVCGEDAGFANPIEASAQGGAKIAAEIAGLMSAHEVARRRPEVFAGGTRRGG